MSSESSHLALFDFDGTLSHRDSLLEFFKFTHGFKRYFKFLIASPVLVLYKLKLISNSKAKQHLFGVFYRNTAIQQFEQWTHHFGQTIVPAILREKALEKLQWHREQKHRIIVVSATMEDLLAGWCASVGAELLGTQLEHIENRLTGRFSGKNCHGHEKVRRIKELLDPKDYATIYAYGDTTGDRPMLALAHEQHYKPFRT